MSKKDRMKNGLDLLFEDNFAEPDGSGGGVQTLRTSLIEPDKKQPRTEFDEERLRELAENIERHGVLQPILVRPGKNGSYKIVAGERRWRAARIAGLKELPAVVRELSDFEAAQISLVENLQREDLNPMEEARAYRRLMDEFGMTQEEVAASVGRSRGVISNSVRLLQLPESMAEAVSAGRINAGQARVLCGASDEEQRERLFELAAGGASVRELEAAAAAEKAKSLPVREPTKKKKEQTEFDRYAVETRLSFKQTYGIDANVERKGKSYSMSFSFKNEDELKSFIEELSNKL